MDKVNISAEEKKAYIAKLAEELPVLRTKAGLQQGELSEIIGVSRQTYGAIERGDKVMSWNTYLALLFFFDKNRHTHQLLRHLGIYSQDLIDAFNNGEISEEDKLFADFPLMEILNAMDEQGLHAIHTVMLMEYSRCKHISGDEVIKNFGGDDFYRLMDEKEAEIANAVKEIKKKRT